MFSSDLETVATATVNVVWLVQFDSQCLPFYSSPRLVCSVQTTKRFANEAWDSQYYLLLKKGIKLIRSLQSGTIAKKTPRQNRWEKSGKKTMNILSKTLPGCCYFNINLLWQERQRKVRQLGKTVRLRVSPLPLAPSHTANGPINTAARTRPHMAGGLGGGEWRCPLRSVLRLLTKVKKQNIQWNVHVNCLTIPYWPWSNYSNQRPLLQRGWWATADCK